MDRFTALVKIHNSTPPDREHRQEIQGQKGEMLETSLFLFLVIFKK